jgi:hypothetical protein
MAEFLRREAKPEMNANCLGVLQRYFQVTDEYRVEAEGDSVFSGDVILDLPAMGNDVFLRNVLVGRDAAIRHFVSKGKPAFRRHTIDEFACSDATGVAVVTSHLPDDRVLPLLCHWQVDSVGLLRRYAVWVLGDEFRRLAVAWAQSPHRTQDA